MKITDRAIKTTRSIGAILLLVGGVLAMWGFSRYEALPNYLRIAVLVPFLFGVPIFSANNYFQGWDDLDARGRGRAITSLVIPFMALFGAMWWYLAYPTAKA